MALTAIAAAAVSTAAFAQAAGSFTIAGERFAQDVILDARALPSLDGRATILVTFDSAGARRLAALTAAHAGKPIAIALDGRTLASPVADGPIDSGTVEIAAAMPLAEAEAIAKRISGKDPLPEEFDE